jgi:hypothetical protein
MRKVLAFALIGLIAAPVFAQGSVVVPNANANVMGTGGLNSPLREFTRTFVELLPASQLASVPVGAQITGIQFRQYYGATTPWPAVNVPWNNYDIYVGNAAVTSLNTSIAANYVAGTRTQVRAGPMTIPANSFGVGSPTHPFGYVMSFSTPYTYTGGGLVIEITHDGNLAATAAFCDHPLGFMPGTVQSGYNTTYNATTLAYTYDAPLTTQVTWVPEPASLLVLVLGLALRRR